MDITELTQEQKNKIKEIIARMHCSNDFKCCDDDFADLCRAADSNVAGLLDCLEEPDKADACVFSLCDRSGHRVCRCQLRVYLGKSLMI
ncbi:MAG: hypothetical protein ACYSSP_04585 [Planctomycetota bacterium]